MQGSNWTETYRKGYHAIQFYSSDQERLQAIHDILGWMGEGDVLVYFTIQPDQGFLDSLESAISDRISKAISSGRLVVRDSYSFYCPNGEFDGSDRAKSWLQLMDHFKDLGYDELVVVGDLSWAARDHELLDEIIKYEAKVTMNGLPSGMTAVCQYDTRLLDEMDIDCISSVHEFQIDNDGLKRNYWLISNHHN